MASAVDTQQSAGSSSTQSVTLNFTGVNRGLFAWLGNPNTGGLVVTAATLDGVNVLSSLSSVVALNGKNFYSLKLATSLSGPKVLLVTWGASDFTILVASALADADPDPSTWAVVNQGAGAQASQPSFTITSGGTSDLMLAFLQDNSGATLTPTSPATLISPVNGTFRQAMQRAGASGATVIAGTYGATPERYGVAVNIKNAGAGGGSTLLAKLNHFLRA